MYAADAAAAVDASPATASIIEGAALSWTPPISQCLVPGRYAWAVRARTDAGWSEWSAPRFFAAQAMELGADLRRLVEQLVEARLAEGALVSTSAAAGSESQRNPAPPLNARDTAVAVAAPLSVAPGPCVAGGELFTDVPASSPYCTWIEQFYRDGLGEGCGAGKFCPTSPVTRQQMAKMLETALRKRGVRQIDTGDYHTCALSTNGRVACWGSSPWAPSMSFAAIAAGQGFTCAIQENGEVTCWGENDAGQLASPPGIYSQIAAGGDHACALESGGEVACWGGAWSGEPPPQSADFRAVSTGNSHACGVKTDGTLACWGFNQAGQASPPAGTFSAVDAGWSHSCGIRTDGSLTCWGSNTQGESTPPAGTFRAVAAGGSHSCAVRTDGLVVCWGGNASGQATAPWGNFVAVSTGSLHSCGLTADGAVECWGYNGVGSATPPSWL